MLIRTYLLGSASNWNVIFVQHNTHFFHETDLLFVVAIELGASCRTDRCSKGGVDFREQTEDVLSRDDLGLGG